jgi:hypothetical protein
LAAKRSGALTGRDDPARDPPGVRVGDERHISEIPICQARVGGVRKMPWQHEQSALLLVASKDLMCLVMPNPG